MSHPVLANPWVRAVGVLLAIVLVGILAYILRPVLIPLFLAFIVAYVFDPVVDYFEARRVPRGVTIAGLAILGILVILCVPFVVVPGIISQGDAIITSARSEVGRGNEWLEQLVDSPQVERVLQQAGWIDPNDKNPDTLAIIRTKVGEYVREQSLQFVRNNAGTLAVAGRSAGVSIAGLFASLGNSALKVILFVANFALFAFVAGYLLKDFDSIVQGGRSLIPPRHSPKTVEIVGKIDSQLRSFLRGQTTVCFCLGAMYTVGFLISGLQVMALVIGAFGMLASFIPYLGVLFVAVFSLTMAIAQYGLDWHVLGVLITIGIVQVLEGNVITPKIVGEQVGLSPVWVILAIMVFGSFLGFLGLLLAVPIAAVLKVLVVESVDAYKRSPVFEGGPAVTPDSPSPAALERPPARKKRR
ncbi:MAG: AI-2E family transporter [Candidatus Hydrogenedentes bacterium]|nr:AI-2E family transporter [Candidatus Hydrogenedentota bacterium]